MKKYINLLTLVIIASIVFIISSTLFAQDVQAVNQTEAVVTTPHDTFAEYFASLAGLAALTLTVTQWFKRGLEAFKIVLQGTAAGMLSWVVALLLCTGGYFFNIGILAGVHWYLIIIYGLAVGLISNGLFSLEHVKVFLEAIKLSPKTVK
jgi:hypothetical protein